MNGKEEILKDWIPKKDTQQEEFLNKYPEYDGRGIKIAIIDSPIDFSMPGLQRTTTGLPKIIDFFEFSNFLSEDGKIDISMIREIDGDNVITGLSGKKLKIPLTWKNPSGKWHIGCKAYSELFFRKFAETKNKENGIEKLEIEELNKNVDLVDCIVWNDGKKWQACLTTSNENLQNAKVLTNFCDEHEFGFIKSYCITIREDKSFIYVFRQNGNNHGTIVATVAAAYFPNGSYSNGLAPGSQIISMDAKHVFAIEKALLKCIEMEVDIVNLSIGLKYTPSIDLSIHR
uniref:Peptidase S8/S53 domain-containing protein n=1 Tax=Panagrolaimus davidi TaxID=227884 RepID=A0A914PTV4_9BILA